MQVPSSSMSSYPVAHSSHMSGPAPVQLSLQALSQAEEKFNSSMWQVFLGQTEFTFTSEFFLISIIEEPLSTLLTGLTLVTTPTWTLSTAVLLLWPLKSDVVVSNRLCMCHVIYHGCMNMYLYLTWATPTTRIGHTPWTLLTVWPKCIVRTTDCSSMNRLKRHWCFMIIQPTI